MAEKKATYQNVEIVRTGEQIILPAKMTYDQAIEWMRRKQKEEESEVAIHEVVKAALPLEGAYAFQKALERKFGWTDFKKPGFFESGPTAVSLEVGFKTTVSVVWGKFNVPGLDGWLGTGYNQDEPTEKPYFVIEGSVKKKHEHLVKEVAELTRKIVAEESIYRGKAITISYPTKYNLITHTPKFLDISKVDPSQLIFPGRVQHMVEHTLFAPLLHTQACREAKIPLKRGVLLEGPFGVGKTLTQYVTAKHATDNGWTYIYIEDTKDLAKALRFAANYQPAVVSAEDIDRADQEGARSDQMNTILNTIDGVEFKDAEIIVLLTTNHVEKLAKALLRPGRLDAVIPVRPPDQGAVQRLIKLYARDRLAEGEDLLGVGERLAGQIPAVIREVVERAKLSAVARTGKAEFLLEALDLEIAAEGMLEHLALMKGAEPDTRSERVKAAEIVAKAIESSLDSGLTEREIAEFEAALQLQD